MDFLKGIDLQDSFVLGWSYKNKTLVLNLEFSIWPESEYYLSPKADEYTCYRKGSLTFLNVSDVKGLIEQPEVKGTQDLDGSIDYGNIDYFEHNHPFFKIVSSFGNIEFESTAAKLELRT